MATIQDLRKTITATISTGATGLSDGYYVGGYRLLGIQNASTWTTAALTFLAAVSSSATYRSIYTSTGGEISVTTTGLQSHTLADDVSRQLSAYPWLQLRSGSLAAATTQAAAATIYLMLGPW